MTRVNIKLLMRRLGQAKISQLSRILGLCLYLGFMCWALGYWLQIDLDWVLGPKIYSESEVPKMVHDFEGRVVPGKGDNGEGAVFAQTPEQVDKEIQDYSFNKFASDRVDFKRLLPDVR